MKFNNEKERWQFVQDNLPLVTLSYRKAFSNEPIDEDTCSALKLYFITSIIDNFNPDSGYKFSTYAVNSMMLKAKEIRNKDKIIKPIRRHGDKYDFADVRSLVSTGKDGNDLSLEEVIQGDYNFAEQVENRDLLKQILNDKEIFKNERDLEVFIYFLKEMKQKDIAQELNLNQPNISRIICKKRKEVKRKYEKFLL